MLAECERPLIYAGGGVIHGEAADELDRVREGFRHPGRDDADGYRRVRYDAAARRCACSACTARPSPITRWTIATC